MVHDPHTGRTLGRKLTAHEVRLMANLYVRLVRRQRRLERVAGRYRETVEVVPLPR